MVQAPVVSQQIPNPALISSSHSLHHSPPKNLHTNPPSYPHPSNSTCSAHTINVNHFATHLLTILRAFISTTHLCPIPSRTASLLPRIALCISNACDTPMRLSCVPWMIMVGSFQSR